MYEQKKTGGKTHAQAGCDECGWWDGDFLTAVKSSYEHTARTGHKTWLETGYSYRRIPLKFGEGK